MKQSPLITISGDFFIAKSVFMLTKMTLFVILLLIVFWGWKWIRHQNPAKTPAIQTNLLPAKLEKRQKILLGRWIISKVNGKEILPAHDWLEKPAKAYFEFQLTEKSELNLIGYSGCNAFGSLVFQDENGWQTPQITMTERGCSKPLQQQEQNIHQLLVSRNVWNSVILNGQNNLEISVGKISLEAYRDRP